MSYRNITVDGKTYQYALGRTHLKIKNFGLFLTSAIGNPLGRHFVVTPRTVAKVIKGETLPEVFHCERHEVSTTQLAYDPYSCEVYGKYDQMISCTKCLDQRSWDI